MSNDWIPIEKADGCDFDYRERYEITYASGVVDVVNGARVRTTGTIAFRLYNPTPYVAPVPIDPGEGWRLLEPSERKQPGDDSSRRDHIYWLHVVESGEQDPSKVYRRRIEPTYRPFANAAEYAPHRDRWIINKPYRVVMRLSSYADDTDWKGLFERCEFEDGTPFGVEVTK